MSNDQSIDNTGLALDVQAVVKNFRRGRGLKKKITKAVDGATLELKRGELFGRRAGMAITSPRHDHRGGEYVL